MRETDQLEIDQAGGTLHLSGALTVRTVTAACKAFADLPSDLRKIDLAEIDRLDTAGAWALIGLQDRMDALEITGARNEAESLMQTVRQAMPDPESRPETRASLVQLVEALGRRVISGVGFFLQLAGYLGIFLSRLARMIRHPSEFKLTSLVHHCEEVGFKAVPIVALMSFLIGVVLAFQGSVQLQQFGAEVFVVDLIAISILRELGILLTSIIVAGRTASAFTAAIGSMKMREEIDAMRTLGLDPAMNLFVPRILALLLMLPILGLIANIAGLFGGALMAWLDLGISPAMFRTRLVEGTSVWHVFVGLIKAPFFAMIIGVVGCHAGMQVQSNAESLGRQTSNAVVTAIFAVIVADAVFSIFFARVGI
ncbi:MlaE family lipid ABC transporter permease subunit [Marivita sp. GX14005]|uniref:ABC transporter permease n=1 Tax=Marivita sp. GX14005 TaxID=2942276 RepID=UPI00201926F1|nr:MlaE family lipid ABC transporter permease subunit [Marivita sp. GX14005]MCL3881192.1 ABC transporter permease [Marivita sp. GX14005]